ncbi:hypothetical protein COOONC_04909 [Cooperia oncophora]
MRFSTTNRLEEHVRLEHIKPPKPVKEVPVVVKKESCYGWRPRVYYPVRAPACRRLDKQSTLCIWNKHNFEVTFTPIDCNADVRGAQRRKRFHRHAYRIQPTSSLPPKLARQDDNVVSSQVSVFFYISILLCIAVSFTFISGPFV